MRRTLILGTSGHIDHGKTTLVRALTGVDTDRLVEEKARGITIDLGFAELVEGDVVFGVVDVPGHEGFVRNMLAGATGMDAALLVVAADEGVMPQTREHVAILDLLGVRCVVVALTRSDIADPEWAELVEEEVRELLSTTGFPAAPIVRTAVPPEGDPQGLAELRSTLVEAATADAGMGGAHAADDLLQLPIDRVFTVKGTGTVVTGTLLGGALTVGDAVAVAPEDLRARVRGLQMHGRDVERATPGARVAVALTGPDIDREALTRGQVLGPDPAWPPSRMLTARVRVLPDTGWELVDGQRVRVHLGTAEVMARCVVLWPEAEARDRVGAGEEGWVQLRLESSVSARVGMSMVIRAWSPVTTIAGGIVAESHPPRRAGSAPTALLERRIGDDPVARLDAALEVAGAAGLAAIDLPVRTGLTPAGIADARDTLLARGGLAAPDGRLFAPAVADAAAERILALVRETHTDEPWQPGPPLPRVRERVGRAAHASLVDALLARMSQRDELVVEGGHVRDPGFETRLSEAQIALRDELAELYEEAALEPPRIADLPERITEDPAFHTLLRGLEAEDQLVALDEEYRIDAAALVTAVQAVRRELAGRTGLGPSDFREFIPVSRRWLLPILAYLDRTGVTRFEGGERSVGSGPDT